MRKQHMRSYFGGKTSDVSFDDWYDEMSTDWRQKAARLQARRWRMIKRQLV